MGLPQTVETLSREEFIAWEDAQPDKHEFVAGKVFAMLGVRRVPVMVVGNCAALDVECEDA